ncbi:MAG: DUF3347 domain-containing protein [Bacteroidales bacterium]
MKNIILGLAIAATTLAACNNNSNKSTESQNVSNNTHAISQTDNATITTSSVADAKNTVSIKEIVSTYLQLKNALTKDNSTDAATAGTTLEAAFKNFDKTALTAAQKKTFEDVEDDAREHAEHIGKNGGNIIHQREHFEILSKDMYDLVKTFGGGQVLFKVFCPMYNNGKGAFWLSETKEIKNPYMGKAMPTCGTIQEELR